MATRFDLKTKTFFSIPPKVDHKSYYDNTSERVVFIDQAFDLNSIIRISETYQVTELCYRFYVYLGFSESMQLSFDFKRKGDALMAHRELSRAWTRTGEFVYADEELQTGEGPRP